MKRSAFWALVLAVLLAGCAESAAGTAHTEPAAVPAIQETAPQATEPAPSPEPEGEHPMVLGRVEDGVYTNTYAGIGCRLGDGWSWATAQELQELSREVREALDGTAVGSAIQDGTQIYDMQAQNGQALTTTNVVFTKLSGKERLAYALMSDEDLIRSNLEQKDALVESYAKAGIIVTAMEAVQVSFLGERRTALRTESTYQGVAYYMLQAFDYRLGEFGMTLTVGSFQEDHTRELLELYNPL